jgi:hypothetical protein
MWLFNKATKARPQYNFPPGYVSERSFLGLLKSGVWAQITKPTFKELVATDKRGCKTGPQRCYSQSTLNHAKTKCRLKGKKISLAHFLLQDLIREYKLLPGCFFLRVYACMRIYGLLHYKGVYMIVVVFILQIIFLFDT